MSTKYYVMLDDDGNETRIPASEAELHNPEAQQMDPTTWCTERTMTAAEYAIEEDELMWEGIRNPSLSQEQLVATAEKWVANNDERTTVKYDDGSEHMLMTYLTEVEEWVSAMLAAESAA